VQNSSTGSADEDVSLLTSLYSGGGRSDKGNESDESDGEAETPSDKSHPSLEYATSEPASDAAIKTNPTSRAVSEDVTTLSDDKEDVKPQVLPICFSYSSLMSYFR
jgi:hypothetical protein